ncbi:putative ATP-dependent endonuclease of the OLD family [Desulfitobacterium dehalogenans ATCC 51507]|uniref:Putative ATP-dependent endonuclease of the OLD family n=1 Tax=Desulfitobacterium dehalogenans (strain ATCC 51507 / DSM 9161 / JW/IU-DC1) TaxID=756499 RepID=I4A4W6_DESDJ|nr:AAA family ATPase [Desulfitobacterium dehalogenans]AFL99000.1 putative ATP-dependent endonuclease of the OLD family [Desulfitobacterium dehalogenans ATCC 51507]
MNQPQICKIHIKNYRNFSSVGFDLSDRQVIIGENNVGKSNLLRAMQLILDPSLSDEDRRLEESDFFDGLEAPMENNQEILIELYIDNYFHIKNVLCQLSDATVDLDGRKVLKLSYKFFPQEDASGKVNYTYIIYKGDDETNFFTHGDRKYLNMRVIKAIRDVEAEMRNSRTSPLTRIIKQKYDIRKEDLIEISEALKSSGANMLNLPEINDLQTKISKLFNSIISYSEDEFGISLRTMDIDASRLLYALRPLIDKRESGNTSLGINNVLYITLTLLLIQDDTIKTYLSPTLYKKLTEQDGDEIVQRYYRGDDQTGYHLTYDLKDVDSQLYDFLYEHNSNTNGVTILAIEEPEAHLHPIFQRLLYKYVVLEANASLIITTHSTHISSVAPIKSIIHLVGNKSGTEVYTAANLNSPDKEISDLERYIDVKRGEIYLAKGIIFVEGIAEEYLVPSFAKRLGCDLDRLGVIVCNINSTNFWPYKQFADLLGIPNVIITDGDYYHTVNGEKIFGDLSDESHANFGYFGNERMEELYELFIDEDEFARFAELDITQQDEKLNKHGIFVGFYTFETDILNKIGKESDRAIICSVFNELTEGGQQQKDNFKANLVSKNYKKCLAQIESSHSNVGKGRFSQRLASICTRTMVPDYVKDAIEYICMEVRGELDE